MGDCLESVKIVPAGLTLFANLIFLLMVYVSVFVWFDFLNFKRKLFYLSQMSYIVL